jgi:hypothetical protein
MIIKCNIISLLEHFRDKLIVLSGPRQSGKTFVIKNNLSPDLTLDMDIARERIQFKQFPDFVINWYETNIGKLPSAEVPKKPLVFIDEIHKVRGWRDIIKGTFDKASHAVNFVASGSSAFNLRKQDKGDSLAGRAFWLTLHPVTFREYVETLKPDIALPQAWKPGASIIDPIREILNRKKELRETWNEYFAFGSFPENLVNRDTVFYDQWLKDYVSAMMDRDLKDLGVSKDVERVYQVYRLLMDGLGSTYSLRSISKTITAAVDTIKSDISALKKVLWGWELPVAAVSKAKQIRKEKKFYPMDFCFADYSEPRSDGAKFECAVACLLKRSLAGFSDNAPDNVTFGFYRDYYKREVDFVITSKRGTSLAVEAKLNAKDDAKSLVSFTNQFKPFESVLVVNDEGVFEKADNYFIVSIELLAAVL